MWWSEGGNYALCPTLLLYLHIMIYFTRKKRFESVMFQNCRIWYDFFSHSERNIDLTFLSVAVIPTRKTTWAIAKAMHRWRWIWYLMSVNDLTKERSENVSFHVPNTKKNQTRTYWFSWKHVVWSVIDCTEFYFITTCSDEVQAPRYC